MTKKKNKIQARTGNTIAVIKQKQQSRKQTTTNEAKGHQDYAQVTDPVRNTTDPSRNKFKTTKKTSSGLQKRECAKPRQSKR